MGIENPNNNPMLKLFKSTDPYALQEQWDNFADQATIKIVNQAMQFDQQTSVIMLACWYIWER
jgi:hypothetical protein